MNTHIITRFEQTTGHMAEELAAKDERFVLTGRVFQHHLDLIFIVIESILSEGGVGAPHT